MSATLQRRIIGAIVAVVVVITCFFLGRWQWHRHQDRAAAVEQVLAAYEEQPVALTELVPQNDSLVPTNLEWRPVEISGTWGEPIIKIRNRPVEGKHGYHIAQPLHLDSSDAQNIAIVVNRGFVIVEDEEDVEMPNDVGNNVTLIGHLRKAEAPDSRQAPTGQGFTFNPQQLMPDAVGLIANAYVIADTQTPDAPENIAALPPPDTDLGSHFSYALQWWFFAGGSVVAFVLLMRREDQHEGTESKAPKPKPKRRKSRDEDEEDALIAAWEAEQ